MKHTVCECVCACVRVLVHAGGKTTVLRVATSANDCIFCDALPCRKQARGWSSWNFSSPLPRPGDPPLLRPMSFARVRAPTRLPQQWPWIF